MLIRNNHIYKCLIALFAGGLLPLSLSPFDYSLIIFPSIILLFYSIENFTLDKSGIKKAIFNGYLYGIGCFTLGISWIYVSIHEHGDASPLLAGFLTMSLIMGVLAFFPAIKLGLYQYLKTKNININLLILAPSIWVLIDWLQSWAFTGFPWLYVGYSQIDSSLAGFAPIGSIFGLNYIVVLIAGLFYLIITNLIIFIKNNFHQNSLNNILTYLLILIFIYILGSSLLAIPWTEKTADKEQIVLVQGNIPQNKKWLRIEIENSINKYLTLTEPYWHNSTIIWPETAVPIPIHYISAQITSWQQKAISENSTLILGIPILANKDYQYYNGIIGLNKNYPENNTYYKTKLVPWGEYVPLENWFRGLIAFFDLPMSNFIPGNLVTNKSSLKSEYLNFVPYICYEIAYPDYVISTANKGNVLVTISNDAWFGNSIGPWQHLQLARMRALETGRAVVRSTNNGITAIIDHKGKIIQKIPQFTAGVLVNEVYGYTGLTPIMYYGVNFIIAICFFIIILLFYRKFKLS